MEVKVKPPDNEVKVTDKDTAIKDNTTNEADKVKVAEDKGNTPLIETVGDGSLSVSNVLLFYISCVTYTIFLYIL